VLADRTQGSWASRQVSPSGCFCAVVRADMARALAAAALLGVAVGHVASSEAERHDYCVIGGGLAGLQLGYFLKQAGRDYVILERGPAAGTFFRKFPRHRNLISINKRHTGRGGSALALEHNLRHDWHSLLTSVESGGVEEDMLFHKLTDEFYPHADKLADYAEQWAERWALNIRTGAGVTAVRQSQPDGFELTVGGSTPSQLFCRWVVVASGLSTPNVPDIPGLEENSVSYNDMPTARDFYANKTVAIIGAGNAGFETFKAVMADAAYVHIHGPSHIRMAWETHYVGDLRSVNVVPCVYLAPCSLKRQPPSWHTLVLQNSTVRI
jgi:cation diffusion facilitator CzcD-associated flavoprotein CzcO